MKNVSERTSYFFTNESVTLMIMKKRMKNKEKVVDINLCYIPYKRSSHS